MGEAEGSTNVDLDLKLGISNIYSAQAVDNHYNNHTLDQAKKNLIDGSYATSGAGVSFNTKKNYKGQASKPGFDLKLATERENPKRLNMKNRIYSRKYRTKKMHYMDHLEKLTIAIPTHISNICQQIEETKNEKRSLLIEQHQLKLQIEAFEKDKMIKEVEIGKNIAEMNRLMRELQINQVQAKQHAMRNSDDGLDADNAHLDLNL
ncbi:hypothetical protein CR513_61005, partial [Mucuna pruriens]